VNKTRITRHDG